MNKERRKTIDGIVTQLEALRTALDSLGSLSMESIKEEIETVKNDEQEYRDNMPASLQDSEKAADTDEAISQLQNAEDKCDALHDALSEFDLDEVLGCLQSAKGT